jgi:hypothetical protein
MDRRWKRAAPSKLLIVVTSAVLCGAGPTRAQRIPHFELRDHNGIPLGRQVTTVPSSMGRLEVSRFGMDPSCGAGFFVSASGLFLTTYQVIRGADSVAVFLDDGQRVDDGISVASYNTTRDVALLHIERPPPRSDSLVLAGRVTQGQVLSAWRYRLGRAESLELNIDSWDDRPDGLLRFGIAASDCSAGGPLVDGTGAVVGVVAAPTFGIPVAHVRPFLADARKNLGSGELLSVQDVARRESHLYGTAVLRSDLLASAARVTPLETWQWPDLARESTLPLTFAGPMGRYEVALLVGGEVRSRTVVQIHPGLPTQLRLVAQAAQGTQAGVAVPAGNGKKWPWLTGIGAAAAGAAAFLLAGGAGARKKSRGDDAPSAPRGGGIIRFVVLDPSQ